MTDELKAMFDLRKTGTCPFCKEKGPFTFKDVSSKKEFALSGLCQSCQDGFFEDVEDTDVIERVVLPPGQSPDDEGFKP